MMIDVRNIREVKYDDYDEVWACVRSLKNPELASKVKQVAELSPSQYLFHLYLETKRARSFNQKWFNEVYVPQFLKEMHYPEAKQKLNELFVADRAGKRICICCFCEEEELCHRSILAGLVQGCGCNVTGVKHDYSAYFLEYRIARNQQPVPVTQKTSVQPMPAVGR